MKTLGLIGGMSWESTIEYYRIFNEFIKERLGGWNSAKLILYSVNFGEILPLQNEGKWNEISDIMIDISKKLEIAGCSAILICSNTMHKIADDIEQEIHIPLIHVVDETAKVIKSKGIERVGLLGTKFTMEGGFYIERLVNKHDLKIILPNEVDRSDIHNAIYSEFARGEFNNTTKKRFLDIINDLHSQGAGGIILGCTEIPILINQNDVKIVLFDTLRIHLEAAVNFLLS
jgi:aspartate racemase